jgi:actin-related protein
MRLLPQFVLMVGGTSQLPGLDARVKRAIDARAGEPRETYVSCMAAPERHHAAWVGGSILAALPRFVDHNFVHQAEYREEGPGALHKRCV